MVLEATCEEAGSVCVTTPDGLPAGENKVWVSFDGQEGKWFECGVFTVG